MISKTGCPTQAGVPSERRFCARWGGSRFCLSEILPSYRPPGGHLRYSFFSEGIMAIAAPRLVFRSLHKSQCHGLRWIPQVRNVVSGSEFLFRKREATLVSPPCRFLWRSHPPPRYTSGRGRDTCTCPSPHPPCGPCSIFDNPQARPFSS